MITEDNWISVKPDFKEECLLIAATEFKSGWEYTAYQIKKVDDGEHFYMGWLTGDGEEYGDLADLSADKYLVLPLLK